MTRYLLSGILALIIFSVTGSQTLSAEVEMRMRGTSQTFSGKVISFDGTVYVLETEIFGEMSFNVSQFECISGACPTTAKEGAVASSPAGDSPPGGLSKDRQIELFEGFRDWNNFQTFLEWRKKNSPAE